MWVRAHGCPWSDPIEDDSVDGCALAAKGGHLEVLRWAPEHHCTWDSMTCARRFAWASGGA